MKEFLMDNYIYFLAIIVLVIIIIIGFLADKKMKNKEGNKGDMMNNNLNEGMPNTQPMMPQEGQPMNYQPVQPTPVVSNEVNQLGVAPGMINQPVNNGNDTVSMNDNGMNVLPGMMQGTIVTPQSVNPVPPVNSEPIQPVVTPVMPVNNGVMAQEQVMQPTLEQQPTFSQPLPVNNGPVQAEPMYQPLSEQKPTFAPVEPVNNIQSFYSGNQSMVDGNVVNPLPNNGGLGGNMGIPNVMPVTPNVAPIPTPVEPAIPVQPIPNVPTPPVNPVPMQMPTPNPQGTMPQPVDNNQLNFVYGNQPNGNMPNNNGFMQ